MYWTWTHNNVSYVSWGEPRRVENKLITDLRPRYDVEVYNGKPIKSDETVTFQMQGDSTLGLGDSIWLINYIRDIYNVKCRRRARFICMSSKWIIDFYKNFLPSSFEMREEYMTEKEFMTIQHKLPAMYYWHEDKTSGVDKSWVDNKSLVERLYGWTGMEYTGLSDWGEFTNEKILYPSDDFYKKLNINKKDKFVYFQWHSSGHSKNLQPKTNIKLIKHIVNQYGYKVYVVGRLRSLDLLNSIPGVVNLSGKTEGIAEALFSLAFNSEFIVSPDSAGVHFSEAYRVPGVCILGTLPPSYICSKYRIPTFMYGSGSCPYKPCGIVHRLPKEDRCPKGTTDYCRIFDDIDLTLFDKCVSKSFDNRLRYKSTPSSDFYGAMQQPISLVM